MSQLFFSNVKAVSAIFAVIAVVSIHVSMLDRAEEKGYEKAMSEMREQTIDAVNRINEELKKSSDVAMEIQRKMFEEEISRIKRLKEKEKEVIKYVEKIVEVDTCTDIGSDNLLLLNQAIGDSGSDNSP